MDSDRPLSVGRGLMADMDHAQSNQMSGTPTFLDAAQRFDRWDAPHFRLSSRHKGEIVADMAIPLIAEGGCQAITLRSVAERAHMKRQSLQEWFGTVGEMWAQLGMAMARRWVDWLQHPHRAAAARERGDFLLVLVPADEAERAFVRAWLAMVERGRSDHGIGASVAWAAAEQRRFVTDLLTWSGEPPLGHRRAPPDDEVVTGLLVLVDGLHAAQCRTRNAMGLPEGQTRLREYLAMLANLRPTG